MMTSPLAKQSIMIALAASPPNPATGMHWYTAMPATLCTSPLHSDPVYMVPYTHESAAPAKPFVMVGVGTMYSFFSPRLPTNAYLDKKVRNHPNSDVA